MSWALEQIHQFPAVDSRSGNYSTWPQYERKQNKIIGWRSQQQLTIESDDFSIARKAIKLLQERLQVRSMQVRPKSETRQSREDDLIAEALTAFRQRACHRGWYQRGYCYHQWADSATVIPQIFL